MYVSQQEFHTRLIENELIHKGLDFYLNLISAITIKNLSIIGSLNWKIFLFILMKNIVTFCGKTIEETAKSIDETQTKLKQDLD